MTDRTSVTRTLWPMPTESHEAHERFTHQDVAHLDPLLAWAEAHLLEQELALLTFQRQRGPCLAVVDGLPVYAVEWAHERLARLRRKPRRRAA